MEFNNSGNSRLPILSSISVVDNVETATGVSLSFARDKPPKTVTPDRTFSPGLSWIIPRSRLSLTVISVESYPIYEITIVDPDSVLMVKRPLKSLETPVVVPSTIIDAPGRPVPVSPSTTIPDTEFWANINPEKKNAIINKENFFIFWIVL